MRPKFEQTSSVSIGTVETAQMILFKRYADRISAWVRGNSGLVGYHNSDLPYFSKLNSSAKTNVLAALRSLEDSWLDCGASLPHKEPLKPMLRSYLHREKLTVPSELTDRIEDDDSVDIYNLNHVLIYGSLNFLKLPSYTLEQLYCIPWPELYSRDTPGIDENFRELAVQMAVGQHRDIVDTSFIVNHVVYETQSMFKRCAAVIPRYCSPIFKEGVVAGYLWVTKYRLIQLAP